MTDGPQRSLFIPQQRSAVGYFTKFFRSLVSPRKSFVAWCDLSNGAEQTIGGCVNIREDGSSVRPPISRHAPVAAALRAALRSVGGTSGADWQPPLRVPLSFLLATLVKLP